MTTKSSTSKAVKSKRSLQNLLKQHGPMEANELADALGISAMAVRQHLYALQEDGLITFTTTPRPKGRPAKLWQLTEAANKIFPDAHAELTIGLIDVMRDTFGEEGLQKLLDKRAAQQIDDYASKLSDASTLDAKLAAFANLRSDEGYMANIENKTDGTFLFVENHCPICVAATGCSGLCAMELDVLTALFEKSATIQRTDHIIAGARRCAYLVTPVV